MTRCHISLYGGGGDRKIVIFPNRGDYKIKYLFDSGDHKISEVKFPRFFSPPPPVVNDVSLKMKPQTRPQSVEECILLIKS